MAQILVALCVIIPNLLRPVRTEYDVSFQPGRRMAFEVPPESCPDGYVDVRLLTHLVFSDTLRVTRNFSSEYRDKRLQCELSQFCSDRSSHVHLAFCLNNGEKVSAVELDCTAFFNDRDYALGTWRVNCEVYPPIEACILSGSCVLLYSPVNTKIVFGIRVGPFALICGFSSFFCVLVIGFRVVAFKDQEKDDGPTFPLEGPYSSDKASPVGTENSLFDDLRGSIVHMEDDASSTHSDAY